jgi:hypothetical protein
VRPVWSAPSGRYHERRILTLEVYVRVRLLLVSLLLLFAVVVTDAQRPPQPASQLPIRRVVLYKSGVGYFEHVGSVTGAGDVAIQFTTAQLNDVLKSLTALDLDGGAIANISYNSVAPIEQRLAALRLPLGDDADPQQFYEALRGSRLEIRAGATVFEGRLLAVQTRPRTRNGVAETIDELTLVTDDGSVKRVELGPEVTVRLADRDLRADVSSYLSIVGSERGDDSRRMTISTTGNGTRRLFVSYISEVPIWKSTYRLVLPDGNGRPVLQGWAIVDNTVGQDWSNVELSLVAGAPQSFIQNISQPYYAQRPVVPLPRAVLLAPQTHAPTLTGGTGIVRGMVADPTGAPLPGVTVSLIDRSGSAVATTVTGASGAYSLTGPAGEYTLRAELRGFDSFATGVSVAGGTTQESTINLSVGGLSETVMVTANEAPSAAPGTARKTVAGRVGGVVGGLPTPPPPPPNIAEQVAASGASANAQELGDLFEYKLKQPVTIGKNQSALVPILNSPVDAERVSLWTRGEGSGRPLRSVWLTNSSELTLDGGTFSVIDANAFAGEGLIEPLKPGEKRLVSYGSDLAVLVSASQANAPRHVSTLTAHDGVLTAASEERATWNYRVRNEDTSGRTIIIEHPIRSGWTLGAEPAIAESTPSAARYRLPVAAKKDAVLALTERRVLRTSYRLTDIDDRTIVMLVQSGAPDAKLRAELRPLIDKRAELSAADARAASINQAIAAIGRDQERVRENMKALRGSAEEKALLQRYTRELNDQEDKLAQLKTDLQHATADRDARRTELNALANKLSFEVGG